MQIRPRGFSIGDGVKIYVKHTWAIDIPPGIRGSPQAELIILRRGTSQLRGKTHLSILATIHTKNHERKRRAVSNASAFCMHPSQGIWGGILYGVSKLEVGSARRSLLE